MLLLQPVIEVHHSQLHLSSGVGLERLPHYFSGVEEHCELVKEESDVCLWIVGVRNFLSLDGVKVVEEVAEDGFLRF